MNAGFLPWWVSAQPGEQLAGLALQVEPGVLVGLAAGMRGDPLDEVEDARWRVALFGKDGLDDLRAIGFGKTVLAQEGLAIFVRPGDNALPRAFNTVDEASHRRVGEALQRGRRLISEAVGREL